MNVSLPDEIVHSKPFDHTGPVNWHMQQQVYYLFLPIIHIPQEFRGRYHHVTSKLVTLLECLKIAGVEV